MEKKFKALRFVGTIYKVVGIIAGIFTCIGAIGFCGISVLGGSIMNSILNSFNNNYGSGNTAGPAGLLAESSAVSSLEASSCFMEA